MQFIKIFFSKQEWIHAIKLLQRLLVVMLIYSVLRIAFISSFYNLLGTHSFNDYLIVIVGGMRFDLSAIVYSNSLFFLLSLVPFTFRFNRIYQLVLKIIFYITNFFFLLFAIGDLVYFKFTFKRTTIDFFGMTGDFMDQAVSYFTTYWYLLLLMAFLIFLIEWLYRKTKYKNSFKQNFFIQFFILIIGVAAFVITARGGLQLKPLSPINAAEYADGNLCPAVTNTPFMLMYSFTKTRLDEVKYFDETTCNEIFKLYHQKKFNEPVKKKNVVIIVLESFSREYFSSFNPNVKGLTPFLDSLMHQSLYASNGFANGKHSNEGVPAVIASIPTLMTESFITSVYSNNRIQGIGNVLKPYGYNTCFFHGANNGSFNFDNFSRACGLDHYYGRTEYNNEKDFDGAWGVWDEPFFQYFEKHLDTIPQPFCAALFSLTSHFPFPIPAKYENIFHADKKEEPMYKCIRYTDYALRNFFEAASKQTWFQNTLFVITADHTSDNTLNYANRFGTFRIPIFFYDPGANLKGEIKRPVSQVDVVPSIADYLRIPEVISSFGESVFDSTSKPFTCQYLGGIYQICNQEYYLEFDGNKTLGIYNYIEDPLLKKNLLGEIIPVQKEMENHLKAMIQTYNSAMNNNTIVPK